MVSDLNHTPLDLGKMIALDSFFTVDTVDLIMAYFGPIIESWARGIMGTRPAKLKLGQTLSLLCAGVGSHKPNNIVHATGR